LIRRRLLAAAACGICFDVSSERNTSKKIDSFMSPTARRTHAPADIHGAVMMIPVVAQDSGFL